MKPDTRIIPARHAHHRVHSLRPISRPGWPISEKAQRDAIEKIPFLPDVQGWLVCGPPGCGKTTYISAAIVDALTWREFLLAGGEPPEDKTLMPSRDAVEIYRLNVPEWLPEIQAWDLREFDDRRGAPSIKAPLLVGQIGKSARPILWLEELDDFNPTEKRIGYLHRLVDRVYTMKSTIVASTKLTPASLKEKLGPSLYRRLSGEFEPEEDKAKWLVWDFYQATKSAKPATKKPKAPSNPKASPRTSA